MRKGGFGALLAFTVAVLMFNGQGGAPTSSAAGSSKSFQLPGAAKPRPAPTGANGSAILEQGICKLQPPDYTHCGSCGAFCPSDDLRGAIKDFFIPTKAPGTQVQPDASCELTSTSSSQQRAVDQDMRDHWCVPNEFRGKLKFVIASIPDPAHTHLSVLSDRVLEAIMEGAQASFYLFARSSLPWENQTFPQSDDYLTRMNASDWQSEREKLPGLLIFRKALPNTHAEAKEALFVFVVGERPTSGLNKQQFQSALRIMAAIRNGSSVQGGDDPLLILGPNFSGSLYSLDYLLENDPLGSVRPVTVNSGSVTSYETIRWFETLHRNRNLTFHTFLESDDYQLGRFLAYAVCAQHYHPSDVAILEEDETAYGNAGIKHKPEDDDSSEQKESIDSTAWDPAPSSFKCEDGGVPVKTSDVASIFYPRDISHLRSAYQQQTQTAAANDAGHRPPRTNLPLNIEDTGNDDDSVPTFSPGQTPLSEESALLGIVASLHKQHAKFIILVSTNTLDEIFLSQYLLRAYPEGRIVTLDEDLLLSREVDDPRFQGILSVTPYPLFPTGMSTVAVAKQTPVGQPQHEFPWDTSISTFNAMVSLLADPNLSGDPPATSGKRCEPGKPPNKCADLPYAAYAEYGWPALGGNSDSKTAREALAPPLWLTVIGNDGYWPLAILDSDRYAKIPGAPPSLLHAIQAEVKPATLQPTRHKPWELLCLFFIALSVIYTYFRWTGCILARTKIVANFAPVGDSYCSYGLFIADVLLFVVFSLLLSPWTYSFFGFGGWWLGGVLWLVFFLLVTSSIADQRRRESKKLAIFSGVAFLLSLAIQIPLVWDPASSQNIFFYRFVHITSGVSPLIPFLILALAGIWCAWNALEGLVLTDKRGPSLPRESDFEKETDVQKQPSPAALRFRALSLEYNQVLLKVIHAANLDRRVILLPVFAVILSVFVLDISHPVRSLEGRGYNWLYFLSYGAVLFVLLCDLFRLVVVWFEFRTPILSLNRLPLRRAFGCLKDMKGKSLWQLSGSAFDDFFPILGREMEALRKLEHFVTEGNSLHLAIVNVENAALILAERVMDLRHPGKGKKALDALKAQKIKESGATLTDRPDGQIDRSRQSITSELLPFLMDLHNTLAHACAETLLYLHPRWTAEAQPSGKLPEAPEPTTESRLQRMVIPQSTQVAEEFVCLFYYNFISVIFLRLRTILVSVGGMFVLLVLSFNSYPFQPESSYHTLMTFVLILIVAVVATVMSQMHRDPTLSHITNTTPGQLGWDFWFRMASFVALPLFTLLASQFPEIGSFLFFWAQPALNTFK
jgi:hypothetical protein